MKTQHVSIASAAAVLVVSMAAFAQSPQPASPSSPAAQQSTAPAGSQVTLVGCVMRESEYRQATDAGKGGPANTGIGRSDEFVLIHAKKGAGPAPATCSAAKGTGEAYEVVGSHERELEEYVNKAVVDPRHVERGGSFRGTAGGARGRSAEAGSEDLPGGHRVVPCGVGGSDCGGSGSRSASGTCATACTAGAAERSRGTTAELAAYSEPAAPGRTAWPAVVGDGPRSPPSSVTTREKWRPWGNPWSPWLPCLRG